MWKLSTALFLAMTVNAAHAAEETLAFYELCINGNCGEAAGVLSDAQGKYWLDAQSLDPLGIDTTDWAARDYLDSRYVDPGARFVDAVIHLDPATLRLDLSLPAEAWPARDYGAARHSDRPYVAPDPGQSAYLDYTVFQYSGSDPSAFGELGFVQGAWLARSSFDIDRRGVRRGVTALELDQAQYRRRWTFGDQYLLAGDAFGAAGLLGGVGVASAYDLDPYLVTFPGADVRGVLQAPGTIEVFANGVLVSRQEAQAGPFSLRDLTLAQGSNNVRVVVTDPFAGVREFDTFFYASTRLLAPGLHEYAYRVGYARPDLRLGYQQRLLWSGWYRYGFNDWLTAGVRYERLEDRVNAGGSIDLRSPLGSVGMTVSHGADGRGNAGQARRVDYSFQHRSFGLSLGWRNQDNGYQPLLAETQSDVLPLQASKSDRYANVSLALPGQATLSARYSRLDYADDSSLRNAGARLAMRVGQRAQWSMELGRRCERDGDCGNEWNVSFYLPMDGAGLSFNASRRGNEPMDYVAGMQRTAPSLERGWGYRAEAGRQNEAAYGYAEIEHASLIGRANLSATRRSGLDDYSARFTGSLLWAGGVLYPVQTGTQGHALVRTVGMQDVPIQREHQDAGRTDDRGRLLVPGVLPYQANLIGIDPQALEVGVEIDEPERFVSMRRHGVAYVDFGVRHVTAVQAYLATEAAGQVQRLKYGTATLRSEDGAAVSARIGDEGQVYLQDVMPGLQTLQATDEEGSLYRCDFNVPAGEAMAWLGEVQCVRQ